MTLLTNWIQTPIAKAVGWTLFHFLWQGIAIAAVLAVALLFLRDARLRYAAACLGLAAMLTISFATFVRVLPQQLPGPAAGILRLPPRAPDTGGVPVPPRKPFQAEDLLPWAAPIWLGGVLLLHLRTMAGWMAARRLRTTGVCAPPHPWQDRLTTLAAAVRLSKPVA